MEITPVTKEKLKLVKSLLLKKNRTSKKAFLVEGSKSVLELLKSPFDISFLVATQSFLDDNSASLNHLSVPLFVAKVNDIERSGSLKTNNSVIAVAKIPVIGAIKANKDEYLMALEDIRDPGNLGTIIRVADWYGFKSLILSNTCVDPYSPKTINASMGSFTRVKIFQTELPKFLAESKALKVAATMKGENIHSTRIPRPAIIILGNESVGLSEEILGLADMKISIPRFGKAESLNVAMAASIICDNLARN